MKRILVLSLLLFPVFSMGLEIPSNLTSSHRERLTELLGPTTSIKPLTHPFPLGGYDGFEMGLSFETIDVSDLNSLGSGTDKESSLVIPKFTFAKGLYFDLDVFLEFSPLLRQEKVSEFGLLVRKSLYQSKFYPINISMSVFGSAVNVDNIFNSESYGFDLTTGITLSDLSLYLGIGQMSTSANIIGVKEGVVITDSGADESSNIEQLHTVFGMSFSYKNYFLAFQADRFQIPVYSFKLGYRL